MNAGERIISANITVLPPILNQTMNVNFTSPAPSASTEGEHIFMLGSMALMLIDFCICVGTLFVCALNFATVLPSQVLHPNLKFVLLCESAIITVRSLLRIVEDVRTGVSGPLQMIKITPEIATYAIYIGFSLTFVVVFRNFLGHILLLERTIATIFYRMYERWRKPYFCIFWFSVVLIWTSLSTYNSVIQNQSALDWRTNFVFLCAFFVEILILLLLFVYNRRMYNGDYLSTEQHTLSERYQLTENIRTCRQLMPTLALHFANTLTLNIILLALYIFNSWSLEKKVMANAVLAVLTSIFSFLIEFTIVRCHPFLRRKAKLILLGILAKMSCRTRIVPDEGPEAAVEKNKVLSIGGKPLPTISDRQIHFEMLERMWNPPK